MAIIRLLSFTLVTLWLTASSMFAQQAPPRATSFAAFAYADNLTNTTGWLPHWESSTPNTSPVNRGRTTPFAIEVWQKAE